MYPTLARIALDVLAILATSVPCEHLFSSAKLTAVDCQLRLGAEHFEDMQIMKWAWLPVIIDMAVLNSEEEDVIFLEIKELYDKDRAFSIESLDGEVITVTI